MRQPMKENTNMCRNLIRFAYPLSVMLLNTSLVIYPQAAPGMRRPQLWTPPAQHPGIGVEEPPPGRERPLRAMGFAGPSFGPVLFRFHQLLLLLLLLLVEVCT